LSQSIGKKPPLMMAMWQSPATPAKVKKYPLLSQRYDLTAGNLAATVDANPANHLKPL
jgi:hypothetical protein